MMTFGDVGVGEIFFENSTGEYWKKISPTDSVMWDQDKNAEHHWYNDHKKEMVKEFAEFPLTLSVEEVDD